VHLRKSVYNANGMKKRTRILLGVAISVFLVLHEFWVLWLFPGTSLVAIIAIPFLLIISLGAGGGAYGILALTKSKAKTALIILAIVVSVMLLQMVMHPSTGSSPFEKMSGYWTAFWRYPNEIQYDDLASCNTQITVAAMVKYQDELPDRMLVFCITDGEETGLVTEERCYYVEFRGDDFQYDANKLRVEEAGDETLLVVNPGSLDEEEYYLNIKIEQLFNLQLLVVSGASNGHSMYYSMRDFDEWWYHTGAAEVFAFTVRLFR
jgi:hypothetical protein